MDINDIIAAEQTEETPVVSPELNADLAENKERLAAVISGGQSQRFLGKSITLKQLDESNADEIEKLYARYESKLGAEMVDPLKEYGRTAYMWIVGKVLERKGYQLNEQKFTEDFKKNYSIDSSFTKLCCEIYHRFGSYLTPFMIAAVTAINTHQLKECNIIDNRDGRDVDESRTDNY